MTREYSKKSVLVTGGARGIGKAIAAGLADLGWRVAVVDVRGGSPFFFVRCDVSREADVRAALRKVLRRFGRLDPLEAYAASKGGLVALTHALAMSLGPRVRVNCISPGWIAHEKVRKKDHVQHPWAGSAATRTSPSSSPISSRTPRDSSPARTSSSTAA